jgi:hypothetical protein
MAKLHTHYITNAQKELKYAYAGISEDNFQSSIQEALSEANTSDDLEEDEGDDFFDDDDDSNSDGNDNDNEKSNHDSSVPNQRDTELEKWIDINDLELKKLLNIEVNVVIEPHPLPIINHSSNVFDIEAAVDKILSS